MDGPGAVASEGPQCEQAPGGRSGSRSAGQSPGSRVGAEEGRAAEGGLRRAEEGFKKAEGEISAGALGP